MNQLSECIIWILKWQWTYQYVLIKHKSNSRLVCVDYCLKQPLARRAWQLSCGEAEGRRRCLLATCTEALLVTHGEGRSPEWGWIWGNPYDVAFVRGISSIWTQNLAFKHMFFISFPRYNNFEITTQIFRSLLCNAFPQVWYPGMKYVMKKW